MKLFLPIPPRRDELPRDRGSRACGTLPAEGVFHNLVFVSIGKTYPMQAYKIMHGLWGASNPFPPARMTSRAVLKRPHFRRWRAGRASTNLAERLDCGVFTAAFSGSAAVSGKAASSRSVAELHGTRTHLEVA